MTDRFDEMAREIQHSIGWVDLTRLAAALRAESKRAQEAMRERAAKWHRDNAAACTKLADEGIEVVGNRRDAVIHDMYAAHLDRLPIEE